MVNVLFFDTFHDNTHSRTISLIACVIELVFLATSVHSKMFQRRAKANNTPAIRKNNSRQNQHAITPAK